MGFWFPKLIGMARRTEALRRRGALGSAAPLAARPALDNATRAALDRVMKWSEGQGLTGARLS
jgi:hypothetical protein